jgi:hypothetical protein
LDLQNLIIDHIYSIVIIVLSVITPLFSFKDLIEKKPFTSFLVVISSFGFLISTCISFNLSFGRYFIFIYYGIVLGFFLLKIAENPFSFYLFIKENRGFIATFLIAGFISLLYVIYSLNVNFSYNAHDSYFYGIPFEIIEGDYFSRIKIWDNFPYVWSKYHFFPGSISSIFLFFSGLKNIFLYKFYLILVIVLSLFTFEENIREKKIKNIFLYSLALSSLIVSWFFKTNGAFPFVFFILSMVFYFDKKLDYSMLFLLFFASSLSRHVVPGVSVFTFLFFKHYKSLLNSKTIFLYIVPIANIFSMIFSGQSPIDFDYNFYLQGKFLGSFFYGGWTSILYQNIFAHTINEFFRYKFLTFNFILNVLSSLFFLRVLFKLNNRFKVVLFSTIFSSILLFLLIFISANTTGKISDYNIITILFFILNSCLVFSFPLYLVFYFKNNFKDYKELFYIAIIFYVMSIINIILFGGSVGTPNYYLINITSIAFIIYYFKPNIYEIRIMPLVFILIIAVLAPSPDSNQHFFDMRKIKLDANIPKTQIEFYKNKNDTIYPILKSSIYGKRIYSYPGTSDRFHMSNNFIDRNGLD